jgi:hypothetical protein
MPKRRKSKKHSKAKLYVILVELTDKEEFDKSWRDIVNPRKKKVGFEIENIVADQTSIIPTVRGTNHPVQI